jgi:hypothetical protein
MTPISPHTWNSELTGGPGGAAGSAGAGAAFVGASNIWMWENGIGFQWESGIFMNVE